MEVIQNNTGEQKLCYLGHICTKKSATVTTIKQGCSKRTALPCNETITTDLEIQNITSVDHFHEARNIEVEAARSSLTLL